MFIIISMNGIRSSRDGGILKIWLTTSTISILNPCDSISDPDPRKCTISLSGFNALFVKQPHLKLRC